MIAASATQGARSSTGRRDWLRLLGATAVFLLVSALAGALSFIATLAAMLAYPLLETLGLSALRPQMVCAVLVGSFSVGIAIFSRRYE